MDTLRIEIIDPTNNVDRVTELMLQLNSDKEGKDIKQLLEQMTSYSNYSCFGLYENEKLIGISSGWTTVRIYCGKQLELDNVIIDTGLQSKGLGRLFIQKIENWALKNEYKSVSLNTYVSNSRSHKFYYNQGFSILGFHFQKLIQ